MIPLTPAFRPVALTHIVASRFNGFPIGFNEPTPIVSKPITRKVAKPLKRLAVHVALSTGLKAGVNENIDPRVDMLHATRLYVMDRAGDAERSR
jgi:hypothetical protein